jgi:Spy/CpxP family protein refolding chaperone
MKRFSLIAIAIMFIATAAMAQPRGGMAPRSEGKTPFEQLGLSDEQKAQIQQLLLDTRKKNIDVEAKQKLARIELHELMNADSPDQGKINTKIGELSKLHETLMRNRIESKLAIQKILTPEQRKKAKQMGPWMHERFRDGEHFGPGMMRRGGFGHPDIMDMPELEDEL